MVIDLLVFLNKHRYVILAFIVLCAIVSALRFFGEWVDFYTVAIGHFWSGQALYSFVRGWRIVLVGGGGVEKDDNLSVRLAFGIFSLVAFSFFLFWP